MNLCKRCLLPSTFPGLTFDGKGVCNHCRSFSPHVAGRDDKKAYEEKFLALAEEVRGRQEYDVLMAFSGGKDSTYTLDLFARHYRLRVLALTFDNAFLSPHAFDNMRRVCARLGVDHLIVAPSPALMRKIFRTAARRELYSPKTLERASTICTSCIGLVKAVMLRTALEKRIPFVGFGWTPGQAPLQAAVMKTNPALARATQKAIFEPLAAVLGDSAPLAPFFLPEDRFLDTGEFPWNVHPLAFLDYDEGAMIARNRELGWVVPDDTDTNSTNCLLNAFANQVHLDRYRFHPYAWEIANMVRAGVMTREAGLEKIAESQDSHQVARARELLEEEP